MTAQRRGVGDWLPLLGTLAVTTVLVLQKTKQAMLPASQTRVLWGAELAAIAGTLLLHSDWARDGAWAAAQQRLGTIVNDYYEPRRATITNSAAVAGGVFGALWWAAATWAVVLGGMRRGVMGRGLLDFEIAALMGAITGGIAGAVLGRAVGHDWETRHRRRRLAKHHGNA